MLYFAAPVTPVKAAPVRFTFVRSVPLKFTQSNRALVRFSPVKVALVKLAYGPIRCQLPVHTERRGTCYSTGHNPGEACVGKVRSFKVAVCLNSVMTSRLED